MGAIIGFGVAAGMPHDWHWGYIDLHALMILSPCSIIAAKLGVRAANALPISKLRKTFGLFMFLLAGKTFMGVLV